MHHFQQDGHMAMRNPRGRANYEPNSWGSEIGGPRESIEKGFVSVAEEAPGPKVRLRPESFADHYSQAGQFYRSQTPVERRHIADALVFELSKVETPPIRERVVAHLRNISAELAEDVAAGLGLAKLPKAAQAAREPVDDLPDSPALSILLNGPESFAGRKLGVLVADGADAGLLSALAEAVSAEGAVMELVAPAVAGVTLSDGTEAAAHHMVDGGPSVLFDAVAILVDAAGAALLAKLPAARDFVADAHAHYKFVAFTEAAAPLFAKAGLGEALDAGFCPLAAPDDATAFIATCRALRFWDRPDGA
jgi:catalase